MQPKIRSFGPPVAKLWPNIFQYISAKAGFIWFITRYIKNIKLFREVFALDYLWPLFSPVLTSRTPAKNVFLENVIFWRHMLSLGHSCQKVPKSPVFQL